MEEHEETAATYDPARYERPSVTVDVVIFTLIERELTRAAGAPASAGPTRACGPSRAASSRWTSRWRQAARRELEEETGVRDIYLEQLYTFGEPSATRARA